MLSAPYSTTCTFSNCTRCTVTTLAKVTSLTKVTTIINDKPGWTANLEYYKDCSKNKDMYLPIRWFVHPSSCVQFLNVEKRKSLSLLIASYIVVKSIDAGRT